MRFHIPAACLAATLIVSTASAQGPVFKTPGMPTFGFRSVEGGQADRFSSEFNPAFSFIVDAVGDYVDFDGASADGISSEVRVLELGANAWVDPNAWAYFIGATEDESLAIEEAAIHYVGFEGNSTIRAGRFFIDFGKQMQTHVHELRTIERPVALRALLGEEVKGDGVQWDSWTAAGDATAVRWSLGAFASLLPEENEFFPDQEASVEERKDAGDLAFTARVTGFTDVSDSSTVQVGASARVVPDYMVEFGPTGDTEDGLENTVFGADVTVGVTDETGARHWTFGGEYLLATGDTGADNSTPGIVDVISDDLSGYFVFADYAWNRFNSAGAQYSAVELPDLAKSMVSEAVVYYSHSLSEYQRLRFGVSSVEVENGEDSVRVAVQYTAVLGAHGHGSNW